MAKPRQKFYTYRYKNQMKSFSQLLGEHKGTLLKKVFETKPNPKKPVKSMTIDEMIVMSYLCANQISAIDPEMVKMYDSAGYYPDAEKLLYDIQQRASDNFKKLVLDEHYDKDEYRKYEYLLDCLSLFLALEDGLDSCEFEYVPEDELLESKEALESYEAYQKQFLTKVYVYNQYIQSDEFKEEVFPKEVVSVLGDGGFDAENVFKTRSSKDAYKLANDALESDLLTLKDINSERIERVNTFRKERNESLEKENQRYDDVLLSEGKRHEESLVALNEEADRLTAIRDFKRESEKEEAYQKLLDEYKEDKFDAVSLKFRNGGFAQKEKLAIDTTFIESLEQIEDINKRASKSAASLELLTKEDEDLLSKLSNEKDALPSVIQKEEEFVAKSNVPLMEDGEYKKLALSKDLDEKEFLDIEADIKMVEEKGAVSITKALIAKYGEDYEVIDFASRDKAIEIERKALSSAIGKAFLSWPKIGKDLAAAVLSIKKVLSSNACSEGLEDAKDIFEGLSSDFAKYDKKEDVLCIYNILNLKEALFSFADNIKDDAEEEMLLAKKEIVSALSFFDAVLSDDKIYPHFEEVFKLCQKTEEERKLTEDMLFCLKAKKEAVEATIAEDNDKLASYEKERKQSADKAVLDRVNAEEEIKSDEASHEQNLIDIAYLKLLLTILDDQVDQSGVNARKEKAILDIENLKDSFEDEKKLHAANKFNLLAEHNSKIEKIQNSCMKKEEKLDEEIVERILPIKERAEQLSTFKEKLEPIIKAENDLKILLDTLASAQEKLLYRKPLFKEKLHQSRVVLLRKFAALEDEVILRLAGDEKDLDKSKEYSDMIRLTLAYVNQREKTNEEVLLDEEYAAMTKELQDSLMKYVEKFESNEKINDAVLRKLDMASYLSKLLDQKGKQILNFEKEEKALDNTIPKNLVIKSIAEENIIENLSIKPCYVLKLASLRTLKAYLGM